MLDTNEDDRGNDEKVIVVVKNILPSKSLIINDHRILNYWVDFSPKIQLQMLYLALVPYVGNVFYSLDHY